MKIGLANIYGFRPHMHHLFYLERLLKLSGHETFFLCCNSSLNNCYPRLLKNTGKVTECSKCIVGSVRSFTNKNITSIQSSNTLNLAEHKEAIVTSSAATLLRLETDYELQTEASEIKEKLLASAEVVYANALRWIEQKQLDAVICFNGRMNEVRAITLACETLGIPFITHERPWFGDGIQLTINKNCLSLHDLTNISSKYASLPLNNEQLKIASGLGASRFLRTNSLEWRLYNTKPTAVEWPIKNATMKVLVLPSSCNEFMGHPEWKTAWPDNTTALDSAIEYLKLQRNDILLRLHPNWAEKIGKVPGDRSRDHYIAWAKRADIQYIDCTETADTYDLIKAADLILVNGSSTGVEAALIGKPVICLGPSSYQGANIALHIKHNDDFAQASDYLKRPSKEIIIHALRYLYVRYGRHPQFVPYVKAVKTTHYKFFEGADPDRLDQLLLNGYLSPDDDTYALTANTKEQAVSEMFYQQQWHDLEYTKKENRLPELHLNRRFGYGWIDHFRDHFQRGDLA